MQDFIHSLFIGNSIGWDIFISASIVLFVLACICIIGFILYSIYDGIGFLKAKTQSESGKVTNKYYHGESAHTGFGMTSGGQMAMTTSYEGEKYIIEYKSNDNGKKYRIETDSETYDSLDIGDKVKAY